MQGRTIHSILAALTAQLPRKLQTPVTQSCCTAVVNMTTLHSLRNICAARCAAQHAAHLLHEAHKGDVCSFPVAACRRFSGYDIQSTVMSCFELHMQSRVPTCRRSAHLTGLLPCCFSEYKSASDGQQATYKGGDAAT